MMFCINPGSIVSRLGAPLQGRVTFYRHDTDELATIYTIEGQDFVQAANPQILDINGRLIDTVFFDCGIIDVRIEQYTGPEGFLSVDAPDEYFAAFDIFEYGIKLDDGGSIGHVETIADLREVSPDAKFVWVNGYYAVGDAPSRLYYWDEASEDIEDGGYVVGSDVEGATGKWILLWGDEVLPCTVYGVKPGTEANLAAFLDYPALVGSMSLKTAPCLRFVRGQYTTGGTLATDRTLCFDTGAQFVNGPTFNCTEVRTFGPVEDYIADFKFGGASNADAVAHSSWFKTLKAFWTCKANRLVIDDNNNFTDLNIDDGVTIADAIISGSKRIPATYTANAGYLRFDNCAFEASQIFSPQNDFVRFCGMREFPRDIWTAYTAASFDFGTVPTNHTQYMRSGDLNNIDVDDFGDADIFIKCALANGDTTIDLRGHTANGFESSVVDTIVNGVFDTAVTLHKNYITLDKFQGSLNAESGSNILAYDSRVTIAGNPHSLSLHDTDLDSIVGFDPKKTQILAWGGYIDVNFAMVSTDIDGGDEVNASEFHNCEIPAGSAWKTNAIVFEGCEIYREIDVFPYLDNGVEKVKLRFDNCTFFGSAIIKVSNPPTREAKNVVINTFSIKNNVFLQNDSYGISAPFYGNDGSAFWTNVLQPEADAMYQGNTGNCLKCPGRVHCGLLTSSYSSGTDTVNYGAEFGYFNIADSGRWISFKDGILYNTLWGTTQGFSVTGFADAKFVHKAMVDPSDNNIFKAYHSWSDDEGFDSSKTLVYID